MQGYSSNHGEKDGEGMMGKKDGKGSGTAKFNGYCKNCGRWGHKAADWWRPADEGGGKGKKGNKGKNGKGRDVNETSQAAAWAYLLYAILGCIKTS